MPSTPYDLVKDEQDLRIPLHAEQAFFHGITFQAKLIGWQEVPRPNSRTEIVQAMRRIRYECKVQNTKKRKVTIQISVDGVKIALKKKKRKKKQQWPTDSDSIELMQHPIYRIFYVSHDSSDLKIFSYIARDGSTDTFKCAVFKSNKKSHAMRIVRTVGQAFEVCHKFNLQKNSLDNNDDHSDTPCEFTDKCSELSDDDDDRKKEEALPAAPLKRPSHLDIMPTSNFNFRKTSDNEDKSPSSPLSPGQEMQKLREQLEQQALQTREALSQLMLVREQLITETNARIEAQARTQQLLQQNRELLEHLASLGGYNESDRPGLTPATIGLAPQSPLSMILSDANDPGSPLRKSFIHSTTSNNNNLASINQQLNNLGSINHQLNTLSQQLSGLNQQSQNLQNIQTLGNNFNAVLPTMNNNLISQDLMQQHDLFQSNQELLNRLQALNIGFNSNSISNYSPKGSYMYSTNQLSPNNNTINMNLLSSPSSVGNLTPSPILNRSSYSSSPMEDSLGVSMERNLDRMSNDSQFIRPLSQVGTMTTMDNDGKVKVVVPVAGGEMTKVENNAKKTDKHVTLPDFVTLRVTDETGNVTNTRKISATPSFITRSTSEKVPNRSQIMSEVQRTAWARHTTK